MSIILCHSALHVTVKGRADARTARLAFRVEDPHIFVHVHRLGPVQMLARAVSLINQTDFNATVGMDMEI